MAGTTNVQYRNHVPNRHVYLTARADQNCLRMTVIAPGYTIFRCCCSLIAESTSSPPLLPSFPQSKWMPLRRLNFKRNAMCWLWKRNTWDQNKITFHVSMWASILSYYTKHGYDQTLQDWKSDAKDMKMLPYKIV